MRVVPLVAIFAALATSAAAMTLASADLKDGAAMPKTYVYTRCGGRNVSPQLQWTGAPKRSQSFVLTMIDRDVPPGWWSHWIVLDMPAGVTSLPRGVDPLPAGSRAVVSDFGDAAYDGPCPPAGTGVHHYQITVWAMPSTGTFVATQTAKGLDDVLRRGALDHASITVTAQTP